MPSWPEWVWAGPEWRRHVRSSTTTAIVGAELASPDPDALAACWSGLLGVPVSRAAGALAIALPRGGRI